jgi:hypothetical protein
LPAILEFEARQANVPRNRGKASWVILCRPGLSAARLLCHNEQASATRLIGSHELPQPEQVHRSNSVPICQPLQPAHSAALGL